MKIGYCLISSPFQYGVSFPNDNLNYFPPDHKLVNLCGTVTWAASNSTCKMKLPIPIEDSLAGGFDYTLQVTNKFDDMAINNNLYNFSFEQLCSTYQNHVFCNDTCKLFWSPAITKTTNLKNYNGMYKPNASQKVCNTFFNYVASNGNPVAAGNCLLYYMHSGKEKPQSMSPHTSLHASSKHFKLVSFWRWQGASLLL